MTRYAEKPKYNNYEVLDTIDVGGIMYSSGSYWIKANGSAVNLATLPINTGDVFSKINSGNSIRLTVSSEPIDSPGARLGKFLGGREIKLGTTSLIASTAGAYNVVWNSNGINYSPFNGKNIHMEADSVKFLAYAFGPTTTAVISTDGLTWTSQALTSAPSFDNFVATYGSFSGKCSCINGLYSYMSDGGAFWCGARWILAAASSFANNTTNAFGNVSGNTNLFIRKTIYGNGVYVQCYSGTSNMGYSTSTNFTTWVNRAPPSAGVNSLAGSFFTIGFGNGMFMLVSSSGSVYTSTDAVAWTLVEATSGIVLNTTNFNLVPTYGNGVWIMPNGAMGVYYSLNNGVDWALSAGATTPFTAGENMTDVCFGERFVISVDQTVANVKGSYSSVDGINWVAGHIAAVSGAVTTWGNICYAPDQGKYIICSSLSAGYGVVRISTDGTTWSTASTIWSNANYITTGITYGNGRFYAISSISNIAAQSTDGITWVAATPPVSIPNNICFANSLFIAQGGASDTNQYTATAANGTWTTVTAYKPYKYTSIAVFGATIVAVQDNGINRSKVLTSTDGTTWTGYTVSGPVDGTDVVSGGDGFLILSPTSQTAYTYSTNGTTWTSGTHNNRTVVYNRAIYGNKWVIWNTSTNNLLNFCNTVNGTWQAGTFKTAITAPIENIIYSSSGGGNYVALINSTTVAVSIDAVNWVHATTVGAPSGSTVGISNGSIFCVATKDTSTFYISSDGVNWTTGTLPISASWSKMIYTGSQFILSSFDGTILTSVDGTNWVFRSLGPSYVGVTGMVYSSTYTKTYMVGNYAFLNSVSNDVWITGTASDGIVYSGNTAATVLGSATLSALGTNATLHMFYKQGNSAFLIGTTFARYTTDGGVTWANATGFFNSTERATLTTYKPNATVVSKLVSYAPAAAPSLGLSATIAITQNTGATWTKLNLNSLNATGFGALASCVYAGSIIFALDTTGKLIRSINDGTAFSPYIIANVKGIYQTILHDGYRFYLTTDIGECLTSTDGSTWIKRTFNGNRTSYPTKNSDIAAINSTVTIISTSGPTGTYQNTCHYSTDGGTTWRVAEIDTRTSNFPNSVVQYIANANTFVFGGQSTPLSAEAGGMVSWSDIVKYNTIKFPALTSRITGGTSYVKIL